MIYDLPLRRWSVGLRFNYPLSKGAFFNWEAGYEMKAHVLVLGPFAFTVLWRVKKPVAP